MTLEKFAGGSVQTNGYLITTDDTCIAIDAPSGFATFIAQQGKKVTHLLLTHQHFDHVEDACEIQNTGAQILAHSGFSRDLIRDDFAQAAGLPVNVPDFTVDHILTEGTLEISDLKIEVSHVPGHSPDSITFSFPDAGILIAGDTLFAGGIGRTDLPGGSHETLLRRIKEALFTLPAKTQVFPGHGPSTTIGFEKDNNPYLQ